MPSYHPVSPEKIARGLFPGIWIQFLDLKFKGPTNALFGDGVTATIWYADPHLGLKTSVFDSRHSALTYERNI